MRFFFFLELSPKSSPRTPLESTLPSTPHFAKARSPTIESSKEAFRHVFSDASSDNFSLVNPNSSVEPSFEYEEDDKYTRVDNDLKHDILNDDIIEEDDKYTKVDDKLKEDILNKNRGDGVEEDERYTTVDNDLKRDLLNKQANPDEEDERYSTVSEDLKHDITSESETVAERDEKSRDLQDAHEKAVNPNNSTKHMNPLVNEKSDAISQPVDGAEDDIPDYAVVDLVKKHQERERLRTLSQALDVKKPEGLYFTS